MFRSVLVRSFQTGGCASHWLLGRSAFHSLNRGMRSLQTLSVLNPKALQPTPKPATKATKVGAIGIGNISGGSSGRRMLSGGSGFSYPAPRKLSEIVKLPLLQEQDSTGIEQIWSAHHASKSDHVGFVLSADQFATLSANARAAPMYVVPVFVPKEVADATAAGAGGAGAGAVTPTSSSSKLPPYWVLVTQIQDSTHFLFTALTNYQTNPQTAPPYLVVTAYTDLLATKQVVLIRADICHPLLTKSQAAACVRSLLKLYTDPAEYQRSHTGPAVFNLKPNEFQFEAAFERVLELQSSDAALKSAIASDGEIISPEKAATTIVTVPPPAAATDTAASPQQVQQQPPNQN